MHVVYFEARLVDEGSNLLHTVDVGNIKAQPHCTQGDCSALATKHHRCRKERESSLQR